MEQWINLDKLPYSGFKIAVFPLKIVGASAAPARVVAIFEWRLTKTNTGDKLSSAVPTSKFHTFNRPHFLAWQSAANFEQQTLTK